MKSTLEALSTQLSSDFFEDIQNNDSAAFLLTLFDALPNSILIVDCKNRICFVNRAYCRLFKINKRYLLGHKLSEFETFARIEEVLRLGKPLHDDISHIYSANIDVIADIEPLFENKRLLGAIASIRDISELLEMERQLSHFKSLSAHYQKELIAQENLPPRFKQIAGNNPEFNQLLKLAARVAATTASVFIGGESGVGKEVLANAIHYSSPRADKPFVALNCAAIPESLMESELFGYEKGAFTGAKSEGRKGKFEQANGGTIFLDEIGDMDLKMQVKLLRVLQEKEFERVGGSRPIKVDFRLISATNKNLPVMIEAGEFREDLYYRINIIPLTIPPLRERREDIPMLAEKFMAAMNQKYDREGILSIDLLDKLSSYDWPGNIRELKNVIEQIAILCPDTVVTADYLPPQFTLQKTAASKSGAGSLKAMRDQTEREMIIETLRETGNNKTQAMKKLGISRRSFYQKLEKYGLK